MPNWNYSHPERSEGSSLRLRVADNLLMVPGIKSYGDKAPYTSWILRYAQEDGKINQALLREPDYYCSCTAHNLPAGLPA